MKILKPKYFLNKQLKSKKVGEVDTYPAYFRFTIGKSNHRVKSYLIGYLENEVNFDDFTREMQVEKDVINYLYNRFHNYTFDNFNSDAFYLCSPIDQLLSLYICTYFVEELGDISLEAYKKELVTYTASLTKLSEGFLNDSLQIQTNYSLPSNFIKNEKLAHIINAYNYSLNFGVNSQVFFCMYTWNNSDVRDQFIKRYGSIYAKVIDEIIKLYSPSINSPL